MVYQIQTEMELNPGIFVGSYSLVGSFKMEASVSVRN